MRPEVAPRKRACRREGRGLHLLIGEAGIRPDPVNAYAHRVDGLMRACTGARPGQAPDHAGAVRSEKW